MARISVAQTRPVIGNVKNNIEKHKRLIDLAVSTKVSAIIFPELSLTGYAPKLAKDLATYQDDTRFDDFQNMSNAYGITIGAGMPMASKSGVLIGMLIFQPNSPRKTYCKQHLHSDELPYFKQGQHELLIDLENIRVAPAICYESLLPEHSSNAFKNGANIYVASVAKSSWGVEKAFKHFSDTARKFSKPVLMSNCIGPCDDFESVGRTAVWDDKGNLLQQLDSASEGILTFNTNTHETLVSTVNTN